MMLFAVILFLISFPVFLVALALKSWPVAIAGLAIGVVYIIFFLMNGFSELMQELKAWPVDEGQEERLQRLWKDAGRERVQSRFWIYPSSEAQFKVWVRSEKSIEIFLSLGLLQLATDAGLKAAFQTMSAFSFSEVKQQNRRHALNVRFQRWKGPETDFRFWFISFWLYPLERLLKIARL